MHMWRNVPMYHLLSEGCSHHLHMLRPCRLWPAWWSSSVPAQSSSASVCSVTALLGRLLPAWLVLPRQTHHPLPTPLPPSPRAAETQVVNIKKHRQAHAYRHTNAQRQTPPPANSPLINPPSTLLKYSLLLISLWESVQFGALAGQRGIVQQDHPWTPTFISRYISLPNQERRLMKFLFRLLFDSDHLESKQINDWSWCHCKVDSKMEVPHTSSEASFFLTRLLCLNKGCLCLAVATKSTLDSCMWNEPNSLFVYSWYKA